MKLKEIIGSLYRSFILSRHSPEALCHPARKKAPVVVSLTSIPSRLNILHLTIRSLLRQSTPPEKIALWLHHDLKESLPESLTQLCGDIFEIHYVGLTCSHRKLVHSIQRFPDSVIVTCDDDQMYGFDWLEKLYASHLKSPNEIIANSCRRVSRFEDGEILPYWDWKRDTRPGASEPCLMAVGYAGVLYPPNSLLPEATDDKLFLALTPKADDLWFKAMSYLNGTAVRISYYVSRKPVSILRSQASSLKWSNVNNDGNRAQWLQLSAHYDLQALADTVERKNT